MRSALGGRPSTIHENWQVLLGDSRPSSRLIVEGGTCSSPPRRVALGEAGSLIFKDSSANKCADLPSFEISGSMMLSTDEFLEIKPVFVDQVLQKLRYLARLEAELLVATWQQQKDQSMTSLCLRVSEVMIRTADAIEKSIDSLGPEDWNRLTKVVTDHLPPILVETAGDRLLEKTPRPYLRWIMAKALAARMVYREGCASLEAVSEDVIAPLALRYLQLAEERRRLANEVEESSIDHRDRIGSVSNTGIFTTMHRSSNADESGT